MKILEENIYLWYKNIMGKKMIITEKPSVAMEFAKVISKNFTRRDRRARLSARRSRWSRRTDDL